MPAGETLRVVLLGADAADTRTALRVAVGLFVLTGLIALVSEVASFSTGTLSLYAFVLLGVVFAAAAAYRKQWAPPELVARRRSRRWAAGRLPGVHAGAGCRSGRAPAVVFRHGCCGVLAAYNRSNFQ